MTGLIKHSMFQEVLFPSTGDQDGDDSGQLTLRRLRRFSPMPDLLIRQAPIVVFDLETTGLDFENDRIIEFGAIKLEKLEPVAQFEALTSTDLPLTDDIVRLTGITPEMLVGQPPIDDVLPKFLEFISGSILVAHNADFDNGMIKAAASRMGIDLDWPVFCTLKMARQLLPELENRKLDTLAAHYGLTFESRHRAIGDIKVTCGVLAGMLDEVGGHLTRWSDFEPYTST